MRSKTPTRNELIAHPLRMRVMVALAGRELTVEQLGSLLDSVPMPSLYRHIALLIDGGLLRVVAERGAGGRRERVLAVADGAGLLDRDAIDPDSVDENAHYVNVFLAELMTCYADAVRGTGVRPGDWRCRGLSLYLSPEESVELNRALLETVRSFADRPRTPERRLRRLALVDLPMRDLPATQDPAPGPEEEPRP